MQKKFGPVSLSLGLLLASLLVACGDSTPSPTVPAATTAPTTASTTTAATTTVVPATTVAPTTAAPTTVPATTVATTVPATIAATTASATTSAATNLDWIKNLPQYSGLEVLTIESSALTALGLSTDRFAITSGVTPDTTTKVVDFYSAKLKADGWQLLQAVPLGKEEDGKQLNFSRQQGTQVQNLIVLVAANNAFTAVPALKLLGAKVPAGSSLLMLVADRQTTPAKTAEPAQLGKDEQEVSFQLGQDKIYGTLLVPAAVSGKKAPAAIIIAGSGPTDRNGNNPLVPGKVSTLENIAKTLGEAGVITLRYDKIGTGKTGGGSFAANPSSIDFDIYVKTASAAYDYLKTRPEVDSSKLLIVGHSEGGLITLLLANQIKSQPTAPAGLILAAPLGTPYLQTLRRQLFAQYDEALKVGQTNQTQVDKAKTELDNLIKSLEQNGKYPEKFDLVFPTVQQIFNPTNEKFLAQVSKYDPGQIAAELPKTLPVLIVRGETDVQVIGTDVQHLYEGFQKAGNTNASLKEVPAVGHVLNVEAESTAENPKFSPQIAELLKNFIQTNIAK